MPDTALQAPSQDGALVSRLEGQWRSRGLQVFCVAVGATLGLYALLNAMSGARLPMVATALGVVTAAISFRIARRNPMPEWAAVPVVAYTTAVLGVLLHTGHADGAVLMFLPAGPAMAVFTLGFRGGLVLLSVIFALLVRTLLFGEHLLPFPYAFRYVVAFLFTAGVSLAYERHRERAMRELRRARERVRKLEGILPMCAWCNRIQGENEAWHTVEEFLEQQSSREVSHSMCPVCFERQVGAEV
jgi:hypothetical protein